MYPLGADKSPIAACRSRGVRVIEVEGQRVLSIPPRVLEELAFAACRDVSHLLRPGHLQQLANILRTPRRRQ
jgi:fumarate hydratase class I